VTAVEEPVDEAIEETPRAPVASIRSLSVSFEVPGGRIDALAGIDLDLAPGEIVALVGESGSGKSVLGATLLGMPPASRRTRVAGAVTVAGVDMLTGPAGTRRMTRRHLLGAVWQDPLSSLNPTMRVGRQLLERGIDRKRSVDLLREVGVPEPERRLDQWPHQLSGGQRQRVMIAMALGASGRLPGSGGETDGAVAIAPSVVSIDDDHGAPLLVVADEPTTALDVSVQAQVILLFDRLRRDHGCAVLLVTHDLGVAASVADRIVVLYAGRICEDGPAAEVLTAPRHPYTRALLAARLSVLDDAGVRSIPGSAPDPLDHVGGCAFAARCDHATEICRTTVPPLEIVGARRAACHHPDATGPAGAPSVPVTAPVVATPTSHEPPAGAKAVVLELRDVERSFPIPGRGRRRLAAVDGVSLAVHAGDAVAIVGESGCGKTTLLRLACGLLEPDHGTVDWPTGARPQLVYQDAGSSLTPWLSVGRQIEERLAVVGVPRAERRDRTAALLERVGLDPRAGRARPRSLSGGQRQRAAIARALASEPTVLVCDEPVSALDASLSVRVLDLIEELRADLGLAVVLVTHDLAAARYLADEVHVMYLGRFVESAPTDRLFEDPVHPYTRGLLAASPTIEPGRLAPTLEGEPPAAGATSAGCSFASRCPDRRDTCVEEPQRLEPVDPDRQRQVACRVQLVARRAEADVEAPD
jgi:peptide/nickel transport system ATP-binding protein